MNSIGKRSWPVLFVSDQLQKQTDEGAWLREIVEVLAADGYSSLFATAFGDARDVVYSREDLGAVVVDWETRNGGRSSRAEEEAGPGDAATRFVEYLRSRNANIPVLVISDRSSVEGIPNRALERVSGVAWKLTDTPRFNAGRIERAVGEYAAEVLPPFFETLVDYVHEYNFAWHTPGHMGGQGFLKSPSGTAFHKFFGENMLRADLSISVPELGSLLDHSGVAGEAERFSARVFGADRSYYVLNGTSAGNQVVWRATVGRGDACLLDRNCHKSLSHAMVATGATPEYLRPVRNALGIIGPADFGSVDPSGRWAMAALTNSTYDGICYDVAHAARKLAGAAALHFDEAWFAYAAFHPLYRGRYAMSLEGGERLVFATHSTHKLLTALSQASMIHVRFPEGVRASAEAREDFHRRFNETYMMHGSTSPQYAMVASLEVATKMMHDNGFVAQSDTLEEAIELRRKVARIAREEKAEGDWFFDLWQPPSLPDSTTGELMADPGAWTLVPGDAWHGFPRGAYPEPFAMLDPIKLTFLCPGLDASGAWSEEGVPAAIVARRLGERGVVCEKTDYYSWLILNSLGTTKGKQGTLLAELFRFRELWKANAPLETVFPELVRAHPGRYAGQGLRDHGLEMHRAVRSLGLMEKLAAASLAVPERDLIPADAHRAIVRGEVETVVLSELDPVRSPRTAAIMVAPYPPGIPLVMGGERLDASSRAVVDYLLAREEFEDAFPGYESEIHGVERTPPDASGRRRFTTLAVRGR